MFASSPPGEIPPPRPRTCFGREELIEKIVSLAENLTPIALIGAGGIGKTTVALTVLHHDRIKERFGDNRRFIRCDQFPVPLPHFLHRLSKVIGAGTENPEDMTPLRPLLSSREMILVLDNAESILDPQGINAQEIYAIVDELSQLRNICLFVTSCISIVPPTCVTLDTPTLSMEAARDTFYGVYDHDEQSGPVDNILEQLDFHPFAITLLATAAHHNKWSVNRLTREWERRGTDILHTQHHDSLATDIEILLASPMFQGLGPDARGLLEVVAFFPQGVNEENLDWLFPTVSDRTNIFDNFSTLSLTHRTDGFITMLAPFRDYLRPKSPESSPLLRTTKERYFKRLSVDVVPGKPGFEEAGWITSEDANVEHLLDVFTNLDADSGDVWDACCHFVEHLRWHKPRLTALEPKIRGLPDDHPSKPRCSFELSLLFNSIGNYTESRNLQLHTIELWRKLGKDSDVAETFLSLSETSRQLDRCQEGIHQAKEAYEIFTRLGSSAGQERSLRQLASLYGDSGLEVVSPFPDQSKQYVDCQVYRAIGHIYHSQGKIEKAVDRFEAALAIATTWKWHDQQFWILHTLVELFSDEGRFNDAHAHAERAKQHTAGDPYLLGRAMELQAVVWYEQRRPEEAKSEALRAADVYEKLGKMQDLEHCKQFLQDIETGTGDPQSDSNGKPVKTMLFFVPNNSLFPVPSAQRTRFGFP